MRAASFVLVGAIVLACGGLAERPQDVARSFWEALGAEDATRAWEYTTHASVAEVEELMGRSPVDSVLIGEALQNENEAMVRTSLTIVGRDDELRVTFYTQLFHQEEGWRVNFSETRSELRKAEFAQGLGAIGDAVARGMEDAGEAIAEAMEELHDALREAFEGADQGEAL